MLKLACGVALGIVLAWVVLGVIRPARPPSPAPAATSEAQVAPFITIIDQAADPSAVIDAFSRGTAVAGQNVPLLEAYIYKMVALDQPQMTCEPARTLLRLDPHNGVAWAAMSLDWSDRGDLSEALSSAGRAVERSPVEPLALLVAGELLAVYDFTRDPSPAIKQQADELRQSVGTNPLFQENYRWVMADLKTRHGPPPVSQPATVPQPAVAQSPVLPSTTGPQLVAPQPQEVVVMGQPPVVVEQAQEGPAEMNVYVEQPPPLYYGDGFYGSGFYYASPARYRSRLPHFNGRPNGVNGRGGTLLNGIGSPEPIRIGDSPQPIGIGGGFVVPGRVVPNGRGNGGRPGGHP